jgi:hypothetical protein
MLRFLGIFSRLAVPPVIGAFLMPTIVQSLIGHGLYPDVGGWLEYIWWVLTRPIIAAFGIFLAGWWCATIQLEFTDRRDHDPTLLEQDRLKSLLTRTIHGLAWRVIPSSFGRYQARRTNEALEIVGFAAPIEAPAEPETEKAHLEKAQLAYYEILRILVRRFGFHKARDLSATIQRVLFESDCSDR